MAIRNMNSARLGYNSFCKKSRRRNDITLNSDISMFSTAEIANGAINLNFLRNTAGNFCKRSCANVRVWKMFLRNALVCVQRVDWRFWKHSVQSAQHSFSAAILRYMIAHKGNSYRQHNFLFTSLYSSYTSLCSLLQPLCPLQRTTLARLPQTQALQWLRLSTVV